MGGLPLLDPPLAGSGIHIDTWTWKCCLVSCIVIKSFSITVSCVVFIVKKIEPAPYSPPPKPPTPVPTAVKEKAESKGGKKGGKEKAKEAEKRVVEPVLVVCSYF